MADNYKILAQDTAASVEENSGANQANILYTVPENTQASISSVSLINTAEENVEYSLGVVKAEDSAASASGTQVIPRFLGVSSETGRIVYSNNGEDWALSPFSPSAYTYNVYTVLNNRFFAFGISQGAYSDDGVTWTTFSHEMPYPLRVAYRQDGVFIAASYGPDYSGIRIYSSLDGVIWQRNLDINETSVPNFTFRDLLVGRNRFWLLGYETIGPNDFRFKIYRSTLDYTSWESTIIVDPEYTGRQAGQLSFGSDVIVMNDPFSTKILYSTSFGSFWSSVTLPVQNYSNFPSKLIYANGKFVVTYPTSSGPVVFYSLDGINWEQGVFPDIDEVATLAEGGGRLIALSPNSNKFAYSDDGIVWTEISVPSGQWRYFAYSEGIFVSFALRGPGFTYTNKALKSADGIVWELVTLPSNSPWDTGVIVNTSTISASITIENRQTIIPTRSIEPNVVDEIVGGITLSAGDQIRIYSESPDLIAQVYGVEIA